MNLQRVKAILDEINSALVGYDPVLKEKARDLLLETAFAEGETAAAASTHAEDAESDVDVDETPAVAAESDAAAQADAAPRKQRRPRRRRVTSLADLLERWQPKRASERALLGAYFVARYTDHPTVSSQAINAELKRNGLRVGNITRAIETNLHADPPLMEQLEKRGTTKQARKHYQITSAGVTDVESRLYAGD